HLEEEKTYFQGEFRADRIRLNESAPPVKVAPYVDGNGRGSLQVEGGASLPFDVVFPIVHGQFGEDGTLQGFLDLMGIPYVGTRCGASWVCMDKWLTKTVCEKNGIPVAEYVILR